jgi:hypothetical protein
VPHLICPTCRLTSYSAAAYATPDRCPRCDAQLECGERAEDRLRRWKLTDLRRAARTEAVEYGAR